VKNHTGEYCLTSSLKKLARDHRVDVQVEDFWFPVGYPEDILAAEDILHSRQASRAKKTSYAEGVASKM
jgi:NDP-sugar pyrophosphorylase family protein